MGKPVECSHRGKKRVVRVSKFPKGYGNICFKCSDCDQEVWVSDVYLKNMRFGKSVEIVVAGES
jgi:hypothetical protein